VQRSLRAMDGRLCTTGDAALAEQRNVDDTVGAAAVVAGAAGWLPKRAAGVAPTAASVEMMDGCGNALARASNSGGPCAGVANVRTVSFNSRAGFTLYDRRRCMLGPVLDLLIDLLRPRCPQCQRRGLQAVASRVIAEGRAKGLRVHPECFPARCRHCGARCIRPARGDEQGYREASPEEWEQNTYAAVPEARVR
jgi:hypothetical protein